MNYSLQAQGLHAHQRLEERGLHAQSFGARLLHDQGPEN